MLYYENTNQTVRVLVLSIVDKGEDFFVRFSINDSRDFFSPLNDGKFTWNDLEFDLDEFVEV